MKKILLSLGMIAAVAVIVFGATRAFFSDTEKSVGNTFELGTIDISVDGENPWKKVWQNYLDKPSQTNYMNFTVKNVGTNEARVWKKLDNIVNEGGLSGYTCVNPAGCAEASVLVSSEPECEDGTVNYTQCYEERDNLSAFMIYDMSYCVKSQDCACDTADNDNLGNGAPIQAGTCWKVIIDEDSEVRVDNVAGTWIELTKDMAEGLAPEQEMVVSQSYHLMTWTDSGQPIITNWAQGDKMTFDVELDARQMDAPAPGQEGMATANLVAKNTTTWDPIQGGGSATLTYDPSGPTFDYTLAATGLVADESYSLIYYPDPWASPKTVKVIGQVLANGAGVANVIASVDLAQNIPVDTDANYPAGGKVWLVPDASLSGDQLSWTNLDKFLFDLNYVNYDDTDLP